MTAPAVQCGLCPRHCIIAPGGRGDCRVRTDTGDTSRQKAMGDGDGAYGSGDRNRQMFP